MEAASIYFGKGLYENQVTTSLLTDRGQLTMGIRGTNHDAFHWCIFDHFRLHYFGSLNPQWVDAFKFKMGDVNCDGDVTITDVTCLVSYLLGTPQRIFCHRAADLDGSGQHTITDVTHLVNLVLSTR